MRLQKNVLKLIPQAMCEPDVAGEGGEAAIRVEAEGGNDVIEILLDLQW